MTKADAYARGVPVTSELPVGASVRCEVIVFDDGSVFVSGPSNADASAMAAAFRVGAELMEEPSDDSDGSDDSDAMGTPVWTAEGSA
jgi:hypothetical protein